MAYCDWCDRGMNPDDEYDWLFQPLGSFFGHPKCLAFKKEFLDKLLQQGTTIADSITDE